MSRFITTIKVDLNEALGLLPKRATPHAIRFNSEASEVEIEWDDDDFVTPYTFASEFPLELLKTRKLPKGVRKRKLPESPAPKAAVPTPAPAKVEAKAAASDKGTT